MSFGKPDNSMLAKGYLTEGGIDAGEQFDTYPRISSQNSDTNNTIGSIQAYYFSSGVKNFSNFSWPVEMDTYQELILTLELYVAPLIFITGLIGNSVSFVVFVATHLKRNSCHTYLASLAIADTVFLVCKFLDWGTKTGVHIYGHQGSCQLFVYLTYVSGFLSVWYVVAFTVERWIATCHPLKRDIKCTPYVAKKVVVTLAVIALCAYCFCFVMFGITIIPELFMGMCGPLQKYAAWVSIIKIVDTFIILIIPTCIIVSCNIRMYYVILKIRRQAGLHDPAAKVQKWNFNRSTAMDKSYSKKLSSDLGPYRNRGKVNLARSSHIRATRMLIIVSTVFLICNIPRHISKTYAFVMTYLDPDYVPEPNCLLTQQIFHLLYYVNFSVNFFLYSMSSRSFRIGLIRVFIKLKTKLRHSCCNAPKCNVKCDNVRCGVPDIDSSDVLCKVLNSNSDRKEADS